MVSHKVAPAIATNNCVVCKPTELTPLSAISLADILYEAGLPPEMFQIVTGWPAAIGGGQAGETSRGRVASTAASSSSGDDPGRPDGGAKGIGFGRDAWR